jgi:rhamnose transport system permease protein
MDRLKKAVNAATGYQNLGILSALGGVMILAAVAAPAMYSFSSLSSMLKNNAIYGIVAIGVMFVLISGGFDLSTGAILSLTGNLIAVWQKGIQLPFICWILLALLLGAVCGALNGFLVGKLHIVSMLATLGTQYLYLGISYLIHDGLVLPHEFSASFKKLSTGYSFGISNVVFLLAGVMIFVGLFQKYTKAGRKIYSVGTNAQASEVSGICVGNTKILAYTLCGMFCGLAGLLYVSTYSVGQWDMSSDFAMKAISICVLGGISPAGGRGRIDGMVISILMISIVFYFASILPGMSAWQDFIQGIVVIAALLINVFAERSAAKRDLRERNAWI